jgi:uncharacterized protein DUF1566
MRRALIVIVLAVSLVSLLSGPVVTQAAPPPSPGSQGAPFANPTPPCFDNMTRYVDCGDGTVTDTVTGLIWLRDATCLGQGDWAAANTIAASLKHGDCGLSDGSRAGDWRLATGSEWAATMARAVFLSCLGVGAYPSLTNNDGSGCFVAAPQGSGPTDHAFVNVPSGAVCDVLNDRACTFWTSTTSEAFGTLAVRARLFYGSANDAVQKSQAYGIWPVRNR